MHKYLLFALVVPLLLVSPFGCESKPTTQPANPSKPDGAQIPAACSAKLDNAELVAIYQLDQIDRQSKPIDWASVSRRDTERQIRVRQLLESGEVQTGADFYHAALVFQHSDGVEGIELAHELAMVGMALGDRESRWLAAASYDRLLTRLGRSQRFGTQYISAGKDDPMHFAPVEPGVTDGMRAAMNCPKLEETR